MNSTVQTRTNRLSDIQKSFARKIRQHLREPRAGLVVLCSGGPDSILLARLSAKYCRKADIPLQLLHVNHSSREDSLDDENFVRNFCHTHCLPLAVFQAPLPMGENVLAAARQIRRQSAAQLAKPGCLVLTGHQADDQVESVLMALLDHKLPDGLAGMPEREGAWLKVLLDRSRSEIEAALKAMGQPWVEDSSNLNLARTRNKIRNTLASRNGVSCLATFVDQTDCIPLLQSISRDAGTLLEYREQEVKNFLQNQGLRRHCWGLTLVREGWDRYYNAVLLRALSSLGRQLGAWLRSPSRRALQDLVEFCKNCPTGALRDLGSGWQISISRELICLHRAYQIMPQTELWPSCRAKWGNWQFGWGHPPEMAWKYSPEELTGKLVMRLPQPGDRLIRIGRPRRLLSDVLSEAGLPYPERWRPVVAEKQNVHWIPGFGPDVWTSKTNSLKSNEVEPIWVKT